MCRSEEPVQGWVFLSVMTFYPGGMINNRTLVKQGHGVGWGIVMTFLVGTVKYYQRAGAEQSIQDIIIDMQG